MTRTLLGATMVSVRSRSGRCWHVHHFNASTDRYQLDPLGLDVRAAQDEHGRMQGGVRSIWVSHADLNDETKWKAVT